MTSVGNVKTKPGSGSDGRMLVDAKIASRARIRLDQLGTVASMSCPPRLPILSRGGVDVVFVKGKLELVTAKNFKGEVR